MQVKSKTLLTKTLVWLAIEILLNLVGLDDLAAYGEFVFERHLVALVGWRVEQVSDRY